MLAVDEALRAVLGWARPLPPRRVSLRDALGCVCARDVAADRDAPPFDKSVVDGYALRSADGTGFGSLQVAMEIMAGQVPARGLEPGEAALIMTGAPLPEGADAVVMIERARRVGNSVWIEPQPLTAGMNRMERGREYRAGDIVCRAGERLVPAHLGVLASVGCAFPEVIPPPRLAVVPTGDELVEPDQAPGAGQIRNSNGVMLAALADERGLHATLAPIARDERTSLEEALQCAIKNHDVVVITGGVSMGALDLVPAALAARGVERIFHKVRVKPGKPLWFGVGSPQASALESFGNVEPVRPLIFGLPGNPVSGLVNWLLFVAPAVEVLAGRATAEGVLAKTPVTLKLTDPLAHRGDRPTYHPATRVGVDAARPLTWSGSADLWTVARADGFLAFPAGDCVHQPGEVVPFVPMR